MNTKKSKHNKHKENLSIENSSSNVNESQADYIVQAEVNLFNEERLYSHEEVFREFAEKLNNRIGTNIPL